jgi:Dolichyl-phosphate-mannose-protein mannosyltransferase
MKNERPISEIILVRTIPFLGIAIVTAQLILKKSLWLDEGYLALSIIQKSNFELLKPLYYCQVAPILFLQFEKIGSYLLPNSEIGLRLFPLISYCVSMLLFYKIVHLLFKNVYTILFSLTLFAFSGALIHYSNEVKQYMSDVLFSTLLLYFTLKKYEDEKHKYVYLTILGSIGIFLSNIASILLFSEGVYLLYTYFYVRKTHFKYLLSMVSVWGVVFVFYYFSFIHNHPSKSMMVNYWSNNGGFVSINVFNSTFYPIFFEKSISLFQTFFSAKCRFIMPIFFVIGAYFLIRTKQIGVACLLLLPIIVHWFLSSFKLYPFDIRLALYCCPSLILVSAFGFDYAFKDVLNRFPVNPLLSIPFILIFMYLNVYKLLPAYPINDLKTCIKHVEQRKKDTIPLYISYYSQSTFYYYKDISFAKFNNNALISGQFTHKDTAFMTDLKNVKGEIWLLFNTQIPQDCDNLAYILAYYKSRNAVVKDSLIAVGTSVYAFDVQAMK